MCLRTHRACGKNCVDNAFYETSRLHRNDGCQLPDSAAIARCDLAREAGNHARLVAVQSVRLRAGDFPACAKRGCGRRCQGRSGTTGGYIGPAPAESSPEITRLAERFVRPDCIPAKAKDDAMHLAFCAVHAVPYLLTWNFRHLANPDNRRRLRLLCESAGYEPPSICTPDEIMKGEL